MSNLSPYQELAAIKQMTGIHIKLHQFETLQACLVMDSTVIILINTVKFRSSKGAYLITARGIKRVTIDRSAGLWGTPTITVVWRDDHVPCEIRSGMARTSEEEKFEWEKLCYRPGTPANPRDSYAREQQGYLVVSSEAKEIQGEEKEEI